MKEMVSTIFRKFAAGGTISYNFFKIFCDPLFSRTMAAYASPLPFACDQNLMPAAFGNPDEP
jgi:hypothetical protein